MKIITTDGPPAVRQAPAAATAPAPSPAASAHSFTFFPIYTDAAPHRSNYVPSGYMGDNDLAMAGAYLPTPHGKGPALRVNYKAAGPKGWAGVYWQNPANNWGDRPGRAGYDLRGATQLTFWARGEKGGERIHEFRVGGIVGEFPDSDVANLTNVRLTKEWKQFAIDLAQKDLRHIIGGFGVFVNKFENSGGSVFYIDDIVFEGPNGQAGAFPMDPALGQVPGFAPGSAKAAPAQAQAPAAPPAPVVVKEIVTKEVPSGLKVSFSSQLLFQTGKSVLEPTSAKAMEQLISLLKAYPTNRVLVEGHTDSTGDKDFNLHLSELRAQSVRDYLIKNGGFAEERFKAVGYGDTKPVADNATRAGRSLNRRVEVTILKNP